MVDMDTMDIIHKSNTELTKQSELYEPRLYYGSKPTIAVEYVSDIHLLHHTRFFDNNLIKTIRIMARSLYTSKGVSKEQAPFATQIRLFLGDVSSKRNVTVEFYRQYMMQNMYRQYKSYKRKTLNADDIQVLEFKQTEYVRRLDRLLQFIKKKETEIEQIKIEINQYVNYGKVIAPKGNLSEIQKYLSSNYYKKRNIPDSVTDKILIVAKLYEELRNLDRVRTKINSFLSKGIPNVPILLKDFRYEPSFLGFVILGNHEYVGFPDVEMAVEYYKKALEPMGYRVLQNKMVETKNAIVFGGSGFAKYSEYFNANNIINCDAMMGNREYEIEQTTLFENAYAKAKKYAEKTGKCFICASHYPVENCLKEFDREAIYFTGHTHRNERVRSENKVLYADNQIGYHNDKHFDGVICFKYAMTDFIRNPYNDLSDGYYQTSPEIYMRFCEYIGEYIGEGKLIRKRCEAGNFYVIKSRGYYGFFIINKSGLSIVDGGNTKRITFNQNIEWIYNNFNIVVDKYLAVLEPLRMAQVQISRELKRLGLDGTIHGLIVDIDYYNHIMVNPIDNSINFYYSPMFGQMRQFESFYKQLEFMGHTALLDDLTSESKRNALALYGTNLGLKTENNDALGEMITVSRRIGAYGVSRAVSPLQRLFTGRVLRNFDLRLIEVADPTAPKRTKSLCGRIYCDKYFNEHLVIKDDLGEFITLLDADGNKTVTTVSKIKSSCTGKSWRAYWVTKDIAETIKQENEKMPEVWHTALRMISQKLIEAEKTNVSVGIEKRKNNDTVG